jgi:hypothetical protein
VRAEDGKAEVDTYITEVDTYVPRALPYPERVAIPRGLPLEASEASRLESLESRGRGAVLYAPARAIAAAPPLEACVARSAAEEELIRQRRRADAMVRSYTQPGQAADGLRLQVRTTTTIATTKRTLAPGPVPAPAPGPASAPDPAEVAALTLVDGATVAVPARVRGGGRAVVLLRAARARQQRAQAGALPPRRGWRRGARLGTAAERRTA